MVDDSLVQPIFVAFSIDNRPILIQLASCLILKVGLLAPPFYCHITKTKWIFLDISVSYFCFSSIPLSSSLFCFNLLRILKDNIIALLSTLFCHIPSVLNNNVCVSTSVWSPKQIPWSWLNQRRCNYSTDTERVNDVVYSVFITQCMLNHDGIYSSITTKSFIRSSWSVTQWSMCWVE